MADDDSWVGLGHWSDVAGGLRMFLAYIITTVAFTAVVLVATMVIATSGKASAIDSLTSMAKFASIAGLIIGLFGLAAIARYSRISAETGARSSAKASLVLGILSLAVSMITLVRMVSGTTDLQAMAAVNPWDLLAKGLGVAQFFCFLSSLRTTAGYIGRLDLHALAGTTILLAGITVALAIFAQLLVMGKAGAMVLLLGLGVLGIGIWCLVFLIMLIARLARAVSRDAHLPQTFA